MALNMKNIIADAFLELVEENPLSSITIKQILEKSGVSRQTFYNHFLDRNDLISYIYDSRIIPEFDPDSPEVSFQDALIRDFYRMKQYAVFLKQACMEDDQNCLKEHMYEHVEAFDLKWHQNAYGNEPMPPALEFATRYHANASVSMTLSWILGDMPVQPEEIAGLITQMRRIGMKQYFPGRDPYENGQ